LELAAYKRVERLCDVRPEHADGAALVDRLAKFTGAYSVYAAEYKRVAEKLSASDWVDMSAKASKAAGGSRTEPVSSAVTLEGLQTHTLSKR